MSASRQWRRKIASYLLIAGGLVLLFLGGRVVVESQLGQTDAESSFEDTTPTRPSPFPGQSNKAHYFLGETVAKLTIPRLNTELYVVEGDDAKDLRRGPGHLAGTAMPGQNGNCIIAGHRDTHFRVLKDIRKGDEIILQTGSGEYTYRVGATEVVNPTDRASLKPTHDAKLHLVTCYPFYYLGSAPKRFIVEAELQGSASVTAENRRPRATNQLP